MVDLSEGTDLKNHVHVYKVANGFGVRYDVPREVKEGDMFADRSRPVIHVFSNLADVVRFLGEHFAEATVTPL